MKKKIDILTINLDSNSWEDALRKMSRILYEKGYVKESYEEALIKREKVYPTGLEIPDRVNVAIPHADVEHVKKQALFIGIPEKPIRFQRMDDPDAPVDVGLILLLVIKDPKGYVKFLSKLTELFQDEMFTRFTKDRKIVELTNLIQERAL
ncbi:MAG: PTS sugar transporter subunit IIA [Candidatus Njordarchaeales archaeon]